MHNFFAMYISLDGSNSSFNDNAYVSVYTAEPSSNMILLLNLNCPLVEDREKHIL